MTSTGKTRFAILGLLTWKPMSGYDIKKLVDVGLSHFWNENYGQIYPTLDRLAREGLATKEAASRGGNRRRFVYSATPQGREAFREWLEQTADAPVIRNEVLLKLFLAHQRPVAVTRRLIREYQTRQQAMLDEYRHSAELLCSALHDGETPGELREILAITGSPTSPGSKQLEVFYFTLRHGIRVTEARVAWCQEVIAHLEVDVEAADTESMEHNQTE
ncbi:MAG: PadR family transcriptional regulator [Planctomycetales bacterium]|nr:PadR family transcriptional regulator [Planctomycetales bacterium]